jgi:hypothetical protein
LLPLLPYILDCPKTKEKEPMVAEPALEAGVSCCNIAAMLGLAIKIRKWFQKTENEMYHCRSELD